jgi:hypothetical protein
MNMNDNQATLSREELIDELSDAIDDRMDMDVSYSMLAEACVDRLIKLDALYPRNITVVNGFHAIDLFVCGLLAALMGVGLEALTKIIPIG